MIRQARYASMESKLVEATTAPPCQPVSKEGRSSSRYQVCKPVKLTMSETGELFFAISSDLSRRGVGIIGTTRFKQGTQALIEIERGANMAVLAECVWSKSFNCGYWSSGWKFLSVRKNTQNRNAAKVD